MLIIKNMYRSSVQKGGRPTSSANGGERVNSSKTEGRYSSYLATPHNDGRGSRARSSSGGSSLTPTPSGEESGRRTSSSEESLEMDGLESG